jgi:hypothetical protein
MTPELYAQLRAGIVQSAHALGIDPVDLGTAISYETAGTFNPLKNGPVTQWGQHRGLIQFGQPQAKQYGVDWNDPVNSQLGENGAVVKYMRDAGVKPGMGMLDVYSAVNAGHVGRYNASDANNGGAPGTVADKVATQMAQHRVNAMNMLGGTGGLPTAPPSVAAGGGANYPSVSAVADAVAPVAAQQAAQQAAAQQAAQTAAVAQQQAATQAAAAPTADPFGGLLSLFAMSQQQSDAPPPAPGMSKPKQTQPVDPKMQVALTSQTPNVYLERMRKMRNG